MKQAKRKSTNTGSQKLHTSIYLMPRQVAFLSDMMKVSGKTRNGCISQLIDDAMPKLKIMMDKG